MRKAIKVIGIIFFMIIVFTFVSQAAEELTITTYYPSPFGSYNELRSKKVALGDNYFNGATYCWGAACTGTRFHDNIDLVVEGEVVVGAARTQAQGIQADLEVDNTIRLTPTDTPNYAAEGNMYYDTSENKPKYYDGTGWKDFGGGFGPPDFMQTVALGPGSGQLLTHNFGTTDYLVYLECQAGNGFIHNIGIGFDATTAAVKGASWTNKTNNTINVKRASNDPDGPALSDNCPTIIVRLWKY